ncbi:hypothetical protein [Amycolatopsis rifamycinica]|uniref:Lipoprotein n=1 Tax=Amycolatopsis rifamycinica TaxID=287986 RepID=A0A066TWK7_9PSEU|nr:hypothetical protein [Amycolatopsis rifamycinica]KDN16259.1 hypothetical protein DV20_42640 [Amycolatopsis rifamycinica]
MRARPLTAVLGLLAAAAVLAGCGKEPDPRAYPGSESGVSWEDAAARYRISLPSCPVEGFRFDVQPPLTDRLAFTFTAAKSCVDGYLRQYGADPAKPFGHWPTGVSGTTGGATIGPSAPPFDADEMQRFGWVLDPAVRYDEYDTFHAPDRWSTFKVLVKPGPDREVVYLRSVTLG